MKNYTPIHAHSCYSFGDGAMKIEDYAKKVKSLGMTGASLTEHGNMTSSLKFYKEFRKNNLNPIIGVEAYLNDDRENKETDDKESHENEVKSKNSHIILLAKNYEGYKNLVYITGEAFYNGFYYKPRTTNRIIFERHNGVIVTTACAASQFALALKNDEKELEKLLIRYKEVFEDDFYVEIQFNEVDFQKPYNEALLRLSKKLGIKPIIGIDAHYLDAEDWYLQQIKMLINQQSSFEDLNNVKRKPWLLDYKSFYVKSYDEIIESAKTFGYDYKKQDLEEWLDNTNEINSKCKVEIPFYKFQFPIPNIPNNEDSIEYFKRLCWEGFDKRLKENRIPKKKEPSYRTQLETEINVIIKKGFADYFLIVYDALSKVRALGGRVGAGRGSVPGSLASYCLEITNLDPIQHGLYFERFMNLEREDPADIDVDISSDEQKIIESELKKEYGIDSVAHIANYTKFGAKSIIRDLFRVMTFDYGTANLISKNFDDSLSLEDNWTSLKKKTVASEIKPFMNEKEEFILKWGNKLEDQVRQAGSHASGTVVSPGKIYDHIPVIKLKNEFLTGYQEGADEREVSEIGLIKLDLLGLNTCSIINDTLKLVKERTGADITHKMESDTLDDKNVYDRFARGDTLDIFQFGSPSMRNILIESEASTFTDIATINGLFRPAAIKNGFVQLYIDSKKHPERITYLHPKLEHILKDTYGVSVFQEQLMEILKDLGGFTIAEADKARKVMKYLYKGNQDNPDRKGDFEKVLHKFEKGAKKNGMTQESIDILLEQMSKYSEYCFCKAHGYGYALNAYQQMWLKVYHPLEYFVSLLNRCSQADLFTMITEARKNGIKIEFFDINKSQYNFSIVDNTILVGFKIIKGMGPEDSQKIIDNRPYNTIDEFFEKSLNTKVSKRAMEPLIYLGVLDEFSLNRKSVLEHYDALKKSKSFIKYVEKNTDDFELTEKSSFEKKYLEFYWKEHPIVKYTKHLERHGVPTPSQIIDNPSTTMAGIFSGIKTKKTKNGKTYYILSVEDESNAVEVKVWDSNLIEMKEGNLLLFENMTVDKWGCSIRSFKQMKVVLNE